MFCKKNGVLKNSAIFTVKNLCQSLLFKKVAGGFFYLLILQKTPSPNIQQISLLDFISRKLCSHIFHKTDPITNVFLAFLNTFLSIHRSSKFVRLVIFIRKNQPATLDVPQNKLVKV